jgi:hypothetical protein
MAPTPTYYTDTDEDDRTVYHCLYCEVQGQEHHATDEALFLMHMEQRHDGRLLEQVGGPAARTAETTEAQGKPEDTPGGRPDTPPGQEGTQPGNRPDVPPGQVEEPVPTHPLVEPDEDEGPAGAGV